MKYDPKIYSTSNLYAPTREALLAYGSALEENSIVEVFEKRFADYHGAKYCVAFSTGFWALVSAIIIKAKEGKRNVLMPSMTYRRLADVVNWAGLTPSFVDIEPESLSMDPKCLENAIDEDTALVLPVHPIINCCAVDELIGITQTANVPILFDAVESVHETYKGQRIGSFGVGEVFSLHASKLINGVEGGYVCTDSADFASALRSMREMGVKKNMRSLSDSSSSNSDYVQADIHPVHCAYALAGLDELNSNVAHNQENYNRYKELLAASDQFRLKEFNEDETTSYKNIVVEVTESRQVSRDEIVARLNAKGIGARAHYYPALHNKTTSYQQIIPDLPVTDHHKVLYLNLPCGQRFNAELVQAVVAELHKATVE